MLNATSLPTFIATPNRTSTNAGDSCVKLCSIKVLIAICRLLHIVWNGRKAVERIECSRVVAVQGAYKECRLATYFVSVCATSHAELRVTYRYSA